MRKIALINCDAGRRMGCGTYCCKLLVRICGDESKVLFPEDPVRRFIDKSEDGSCIYLDRETYACKVWDKRPQVCREYDCNDDKILQIAVRQDIDSIVELVTTSVKTFIPRETWVSVPREEDELE